MVVLALIISLVIGFCVAYYFMAKKVSKSNNHGDSMGELRDFDQSTWNLVDYKDYRTKQKDWNLHKSIGIS